MAKTVCYATLLTCVGTTNSPIDVRFSQQQQKQQQQQLNMIICHGLFGLTAFSWILREDKVFFPLSCTEFSTRNGRQLIALNKY